MKKRKLLVEELRQLDYMVIVWKSDWIDNNTWYVSEFCVGHSPNTSGIYETRLLTHHNGNNDSFSLEEAMMKAQVMFPSKDVYEICRDRVDFTAPCGYSITGPNVEVFEIEEQEA